MDKKENLNMKWTALAMMAFTTVWSFGNSVNGFVYFGGIKAILSWIIVFALFFVPYALMVGEAGSAFKDSGGGITDWINRTGGAKIAYYAGWTYWACHVPYLASKPSNGLKALSWAIFKDGSTYDSFPTMWVQLIALGIFIAFCWLATKGIKSIKILVTIAGTSMLIMSILFIVLMFGVPVINPNSGYVNIDFNLQNFLPNFNLGYFASLSVLIFAVGGCEKIAPYINQLKNPKKDFPKGIIVMTILVCTCAILGTLALGMAFDSNEISNSGSEAINSYVANGPYIAFQKLGNYYGIGNIFTIVYAICNMICQFAVLILSVDAPLRMLLDNDAANKFIPRKLLKKNKNGAYANGIILTAVIGGIIILFQAFSSSGVSASLAQFVKLNSVCMSLSYLWIFVAYIFLKKNVEKFNPSYKFVKSKGLGIFIAIWCFLVTVIFSVIGMYDENPINMVLNISAPIILSILGFIFPIIARKQRKDIIK